MKMILAIIFITCVVVIPEAHGGELVEVIDFREQTIRQLFHKDVGHLKEEEEPFVATGKDLDQKKKLIKYFLALCAIC